MGRLDDEAHAELRLRTRSSEAPYQALRGIDNIAKFAPSMADYDFKSLSSYDFELLARDLLQSMLGKQLESFSQGPDSGIDFRYRNDSENLVVQVKHYAESGFAALMTILRRKERPKIETLAPSRYVLATSISLTPKRKDEIFDVLRPYCLQPSDVYGREDLNNLLQQYEDIERRHFKLWLTSETVLRRVLEAGIFTDSEAHLERVRSRLRRYVPNPSFDRAKILLEKYHYCIIAGIPGIGKTTLAEVLLADLVDRQGFEAFRIAHDLSEIRPVKNAKRKQAFYFDDFLGKTSLEKLQKNEDQRLIELIEEVAANPNWRFILTTREYILNSARLRYEAFAQPSVDFRLCTINLADYARSIRAKILYNHIYFSDLPTAHKLALLQNRGYEGVLRHRNYNPRVVEYMTQSLHACTVAPSLYLREFTDSLEHPTRIWDHAFRHQISEAARHLLLVLGTLPDEVLLADLETAFWTFYLLRQGKFGFPSSSGDWNDALKQLDGSFVTTNRIGKDLAVTFHSPSIRDYLEDFLSSSDGDVVDLVHGCHFYEQYTTIWSGRRGRRYRGVDKHRDEFLDEFQRNLFGPSAGTVRYVQNNGDPIGLNHRTVSNESRTRFLVQLVNELNSPKGDQLLNTVIRQLEKLWEQGQADKEDLVRLLEALTSRGLRTEDDAFKAAQRCLSLKVDEIDDFRAIATFATTYRDALSSSEIDSLKTQFVQFAAEYCEGWDDDDPDWLRQVAANIEFVGEKLEINVDRFTSSLHEHADVIESERAGAGFDEDDGAGWASPASHGDEVDSMFQSLRSELES